MASRYMTTTTLDLVMVGVNFSATDMATLAAKAVTQAEAEVDKYLSKRYDLTASPFVPAGATVPPIVVQLSERIAEAYLWQWLSRGSKEGRTRAKELLEDAKPNLEAIRDYEMDVIDSTGAVVVDMSNTAYRVKCNTSTYVDTFDEGPELSWRPDADKLQDISDAKD